MAQWKTKKLQAVAQALLLLKTEEEILSFLRDIATQEELRELANRWEVAQQLEAGKSYREIGQKMKVSTATITRIAYWLHHGEGGYRVALARLLARRPSARKTKTT